jgi:hypothetical protein
VTWRHVWTLYAAGILLFIALGFSAYQLGSRRAVVPTSSVASAPLPATPISESLAEQLSDARRERERNLAQIAKRDQAIADLKSQLEQRSMELSEMRAAHDSLKNAQTVRDSGQNQERERAEMAQKLASAESEVQLLRAKLDSFQAQSSQDTGRANILEARVNDLARQLQEEDAELSQRDQLLAHDRDIRELMGARDLYITEVYDVARSGETQKAFGRVFYTKEKSLIFYAYDLDREPGIRNASTFQAWGRRGPDRAQALNLGVFYQDNASKKRWVLKYSDSKTLAQIDAVFVTLEPNGGSRKPSGQPLLFAYLKIDPNHP